MMRKSSSEAPALLATILVTSLAVLGSSVVQEAKPTPKPTPKNAVAERLESRNAMPDIPNMRSRPQLDSAFDSSEQARIWGEIKTLFTSADDEWGALVKNIDNESYCVTVESFSGSYWNWTVGNVCHKIVARTLSVAFTHSMTSTTPQSRKYYQHFHHPEFTRNPDALKNWLDVRRGKSLALLQADACDWAIEELSKQEHEDRDRWIAEIRRTAESLRNGGPAVLSSGFGSEEFIPIRRKPVSKDPFADE